MAIVQYSLPRYLPAFICAPSSKQAHLRNEHFEKQSWFCQQLSLYWIISQNAPCWLQFLYLIATIIFGESVGAIHQGRKRVQKFCLLIPQLQFSTQFVGASQLMHQLNLESTCDFVSLTTGKMSSMVGTTELLLWWRITCPTILT